MTPTALEDALPLLRCPHCGAALALAGRTARCPAGHGFDVARQGYLSLLPGDADTGTADTAAMVEARERFLATGHYDQIADAVASACATAVESLDGPVVDLGAGTGHQLATTLDLLPDRTGLALDISKHALRRAARAHPRIAAIRADAWRPLPIETATAAAVLNVFSPRNPSEIHRILKPHGALILATPTEAHLHELVAALDLLTVDPRKQQRLDQSLAHLNLASETTVYRGLPLTHDQIAALTTMGPSHRHLDPTTLHHRIARLPDPFHATASVRVATYRRA